MGKYFIVVEKSAQKELQEFHKSGDKADIKKIKSIFDELIERPEAGIPVPLYIQVFGSCLIFYNPAT